jgi:serine/threonine protein kinase
MSQSTPPADNPEVQVHTSRGVTYEHTAAESVPGLELGAMIAEGLFSRIYRAKTTTAAGFEEVVAVKVWKPGAKARYGFKSPIATLMALKHVNVVRHVRDGATTAGNPFVVMEYARGRTLRDLLLHGPIEVSRAVAISRQLARALVALHSVNLIHGDLKPNHVLFVEDDRYEDLIKLCDVGVKALEWVKSNVDETTWLKRRAYLAPEQVQTESASQRSDLYGAGAILFEMLTGSPPAEGEPASKLVALLPRYVPRPLKDVVLRLLQKEPTLRFSSAEQWLTALDQIDGRNQEDDEHLSSSPRSAFIASGMSRTAPPGSVRPASSLRIAPWGLDARGFRLWAVACALAACGAAAIVGYRMYNESSSHGILHTSNAQTSGLYDAQEISSLTPESRSAEQWLSLSTYQVETAQLALAESSLIEAVRRQPTLVGSPEVNLLTQRLGARRGAFLSRVEADSTLDAEVRAWALKTRRGNP